MILEVNHELLTLLEQRKLLMSTKVEQEAEALTNEIGKLNNLLASLGDSLHNYKSQSPYNPTLMWVIPSVATLCGLLFASTFVWAGNKIRRRYKGTKE